MQARVRFVSVRRNNSAEIVRVECAKCRRECDLVLSQATLCGDRACRVREMQARLRFVPVAGNPLRRSRASSARNAGESAICVCPAQPSAEIVRVECAKCRRECDLTARDNPLRRSRARVRFVSVRRNPLRDCGLCSAYNFSARSNLWSWKLRTGDFVVQLEHAEYLASWKMRTGDFVVQL